MNTTLKLLLSVVARRISKALEDSGRLGVLAGGLPAAA